MTNERDVIARYGVGMVTCRWLPGDEKKATSAEVIRLLVDGNWMNQNGADSVANVEWQPGVLWKVLQFLDHEKSIATVIATPAGMITVDLVKTPAATIVSVAEILGERDGGVSKLRRELESLNCLRREMLLGLDGCQGDTRPFQAVVNLVSSRQVSLANTTLKVYPQSKETKYLLGWQICKQAKGISAITATRLACTQAGTFLVLVCFDVRLMRDSPAEDVPYGGGVAEELREYFWHLAVKQPPPPRYVLIATHWHEKRYARNPRSGTPGFIRAAEHLGQQMRHSTVLVTMFAPRADLEVLAKEFFPVMGHEPNTVATLLVEYSTS